MGQMGAHHNVMHEHSIRGQPPAVVHVCAQNEGLAEVVASTFAICQ